MKWWADYYENLPAKPLKVERPKREPRPRVDHQSEWREKRVQLLREIQDHRSGNQEGLEIKRSKNRPSVEPKIHLKAFERVECKKKSIYGVLVSEDPSVVTCHFCLKRMEFIEEVRKHESSI